MSLVKKNLILVVLLVAMLFAFGGCGGEDEVSGKNLVGQFIDAPVENFAFVCTPSNLNGVTNASGDYEFKSGDTVVFFFGSGKDESEFLHLPPVSADKIITPLSYFYRYPDDEIEDRVIEIVRLILSASEYYNDKEVVLADNPFEGYTGEFNETKFATLLSDNKIPVTEEEAREHFKLPTGYPYPVESLLNGNWEIVAGDIAVTTNPEVFAIQLIQKSSQYMMVEINNGTPVIWTVGNKTGFFNDISEVTGSDDEGYSAGGGNIAITLVDQNTVNISGFGFITGAIFQRVN